MTCRLGRLTKRPEYLRVARAGRRWVTPGFVLQAAQRDRNAVRSDEACPEVRVGFTASRKVGSAVSRNRARRRLRAAAAEVLPSVGRADTDYVLIARQGTLTRRYTDILRDLARAIGGLARPRQRPRRGPSADRGVEEGQRS